MVLLTAAWRLARENMNMQKEEERQRRGGTDQRVVIGSLSADALTMREALDRLEGFTKDGRSHYVCFCEGSLLSHVRTDSELVTALNHADLILPDGIAAMLLGRIHGQWFPERIQGPRFMLEACRESVARGTRHFLYGGTPDTLARLADNLKKKFPGLNIVGTHSPPFRELTGQEWAEIRETIGKTRPDLMWVALGSPRQEKWVAAQAGKIKVPVLLAVGAAFDFHAGTRPWAPAWIRALGLEWIFRMATGGGKTFRRNLFRVFPCVAWLLLTEFVKNSLLVLFRKAK